MDLLAAAIASLAGRRTAAKLVSVSERIRSAEIKRGEVLDRQAAQATVALPDWKTMSLRLHCYLYADRGQGHGLTALHVPDAI